MDVNQNTSYLEQSPSTTEAPAQRALPCFFFQVPQAPMNKEDFTLVQRRGVNIAPETATQYTELVKLMKQQYEVEKHRQAVEGPSSVCILSCPEIAGIQKSNLPSE